MIEADLARPLVEVRDFESRKVEYEIYTYGEEVIVMPVSGEIEIDIESTRERITRELERYVEDIGKIEMISERQAIVYVDKGSIPRLLGRKGKRIAKIEEKLGMKIDIRPMEKKTYITTPISESNDHIVLHVGREFIGETVKIYTGGVYLFTGTVGKAGDVRINKNMEIGKRLLDAIDFAEEIRVEIQ